MKLFLKRTLVIFIIICTILPILFSNITLAVEEVPLTQERAGNYVATFAINFFNNWSSDNHSFEDEDGNPVKTEYSPTYKIPSEGDSKYYFSKKSWIDFCYSFALSLSGTQLPSSHYGPSDSTFEKIDVADLEDDVLKIKESEDKKEGTDTTAELMNSGKIKPGDILVTSEGDYLLYVGGTKVIYATPNDGVHPTNTGALKYDRIENYFVEVRRQLEKDHKDDEEFEAKYGLKQVYRLTETAASQISDAKVRTIFNERGYYDSANKYEGIPKRGSYDGSKRTTVVGFVIDSLLTIAKFLVNLVLYLVRAVIVGWVDIFENFIQRNVLRLSGHSSEVGFVDKLYGVSTTSYSGDRVTVESVLFNKLPLTDANFFNFEKAGGYDLIQDGQPISWLYNIRKNLATIYVTIRYLSIAAMLIVLLYIGIRMVISNIANKKAAYGKMLTSWFMGLCIVIFIHFFMYGVLYINGVLVNIFMDQNTEIATQILGAGTDSLTLYDAIRTKAYSWNFYDGLIGLIMYIVVVYYLVRFIFIYLKRAVSIYVLAVFGSLVGVKYAIEKSSGKRSSNTLARWMKDYIFNVLLQSIHCLIYVTFMSLALKSALTSVSGLVVAILVLQFLLKADTIFMKIFNIKGSLLDDTSKPPELRGIWSQAISASKTLAVGWGAMQFGKKLFGEKTGIRPLLRYSLNYRDGDTDEQTIARGEAKLLNAKAGIANFMYRDISKPLVFKKNFDIQMKRRALYEALRKTNNYQLKKAIYDAISSEKKLRKDRFNRTTNAGRDLLTGSVGIMASVGFLTDGLAPAVGVFAKAAKTIKGKAGNNVKLYRRLNPNEHVSRGNIGAAGIANKKTVKDMKKVVDKQNTLIKIAGFESALSDRISRLSAQTGLSHDQIKEELQNTITLTNKTNISGARIRKAVDGYVHSQIGRQKLDATDLDGVLDSLQDVLSESGSDVIIDDTMRERLGDVIARNGYSMNGIEGKEFARILAEAINQPDVVPVIGGGKVESAGNGIVSEKLAKNIIREYENRTGITLEDGEKKRLQQRIRGLPNIENMSEEDVINQVMNLVEGINMDMDKMREASEAAISAGVPKLGDKDFHRMMKSIEKKMQSRGLAVEITDKDADGKPTNTLSELEQRVKEKVIERQKDKISGDPSKAAEMAKLNRGQIVSEDSNEEFMRTVYGALSEIGMISTSNAQDASVQQLLVEASRIMKHMKSANESNKAKNKESAVSYEQIMHEILENF